MIRDEHIEAAIAQGILTADQATRLRDIAGAAELGRDVSDGATVGSIWQQLVGEFPELAGYERSISTAVNADYARMDRTVEDGDEVAFLPPVSGG